MAEVLGPMTIQNWALPTGVDGAKIAQWRMGEGITWQAWANKVALALGAANEDLSRKWGGLFSLTEDLVLEYPDGEAVTPLPEMTDIDIPDSVQGRTIGHMIDLKSYGGSVGNSWMYFRRARPSQINAQIANIVNRGVWRFEQLLLNRFFVNTEYAVGSVGYDVPFVRGTAGNVDFTPPAYGGATFTTSHNHYLGFDSGSSKTLKDTLNGLVETVEEHGHSGPYRALVSKADVPTYMALTDFVQFVMPLVTVVDRGGATSGPQFVTRGSPEVSDGVFGHFQSTRGDIELFASARIPTGYAGVYKSYGQLDRRNPLKVRVFPGVGFGLYVVPEMSGNEQFPIRRIIVPLEFGVSVGEDRTNGATGYLVAGGTFANPTIS